MGLLLTKKNLLGLDIGSSSIKAAIVESSRKGFLLKRFLIQETPDSSIMSGEVVDSIALSGAVAEVASAAKLKKKPVAAALWGSGVIVKKISIPRMEEALIKEQIQWEAEHYIPFPISEINLDYHLLSHSPSGETMDILLVAAKRTFISKEIEVVENGGLQLNVLDVAGFALANSFQANYGRLPGETLALLDIGGGVTNFVVIDNGEVVFCRDLPIGGMNYTTEIQKQMGMSAREAETLKLSASAGQPAPEGLHSILEAQNDALVEEIGAGMDFFAATGAGNAISRIFVTGGCMFVPGLVATINKAFNIPCEPFDPFLNVKWDRKIMTDEYISQIRPFAALAIGLAMRKEQKK